MPVSNSFSRPAHISTSTIASAPPIPDDLINKITPPVSLSDLNRLKRDIAWTLWESYSPNDPMRVHGLISYELKEYILNNLLRSEFEILRSEKCFSGWIQSRDYPDYREKYKASYRVATAENLKGSIAATEKYINCSNKEFIDTFEVVYQGNNPHTVYCTSDELPKSKIRWGTGRYLWPTAEDHINLPSINKRQIVDLALSYQQQRREKGWKLEAWPLVGWAMDDIPMPVTVPEVQQIEKTIPPAVNGLKRRSVVPTLIEAPPTLVMSKDRLPSQSKTTAINRKEKTSERCPTIACCVVVVKE